jgi:hypothetical protein
MNVPKGEAYMQKYPKDGLIGIYKKERKEKPKIRLLAAILCEEGKTLQRNKRYSGVPCHNPKRMAARNASERSGKGTSKKQLGRQRRLTEKKLQEFDTQYPI